MSSCPPGYDEHFAALAAGHGAAAWADPAEPDGTARRARERRARPVAEHPVTRAVRRPVGGRARRAALVAVAVVSLLASAGLAARLLDGAEPAPGVALDASRLGGATARPSTGAPGRPRAVRSSASRARRRATSNARKAERRRRARPRRAWTERTAKRRPQRRPAPARPSPSAWPTEPPATRRPVPAPARATRPAAPARDSVCVEFPPC